MSTHSGESPLFVHVHLDGLDKESASYVNANGWQAIIPRADFDQQGHPIEVRIIVERGT